MIDLFKSIKFIDVLALLVLVFCFAYFFYKGLDNGLIALASLVASYYFGSSAAKDKTSNN